MSCWRRLRDWHEAGVWAALYRVLLERLQAAGQIDWRRAAPDSASVPAKGGSATGPSPTDRGKPGTKHHIAVDARGTPLGVLIVPTTSTTAGCWCLCWMSIPALQSGRRGRPRQRPDKLHADKGCDYRRCRRECRARGIQPGIARRGVESSQRLGRHRWVVERTHAWLNRFRRLAVRYKRRADIHLALNTLGCVPDLPPPN